MNGLSKLLAQTAGWLQHALAAVDGEGGQRRDCVYARAGRIDDVYCGHTHVAIERHEHGVSYCQPGCWGGAA